MKQQTIVFKISDNLKDEMIEFYQDRFEENKPPYSVFFQGGLTWPHAKLGILKTLQKLQDAGMMTL